jgi:hypothetical protein
MFGGINSDNTPTLFRDTSTWDGTQWAQVSSSDGPWERLSAIAATDTKVGQVILYGGIAHWKGSVLRYSDVWTWTHGAWSLVQRTTIPAPPDELDAIVRAAASGSGLRSSCTAGAPPCMSLHGAAQVGSYAAYAIFDLNPPDGANAVCASYVSYVDNPNPMFGVSKGPWHPVGNACGPSVEHLLQVGAQARVNVTGCANVRKFPAVGDVVTCVPDRTQVTVDDGPVALSGDTKRIWWHLQKRGWIAHELLLAI